MEILISVFAALFGLAVLLFALYALILVRPRAKAPVDPHLLCDYAHRGLHGNGVPENSIEAFELAVENGYGIELDVQLSKDGTVMVFHDYSLSRMTGCDKKLCELDAAKLQELSLAGTDQTIPTLTQVLNLVDGRVPILVELKGESFDTALCPKVAQLLCAYKGAYCIESFNPLLVRQMKKHLPDSYRGLLYTNVCREKKKISVLNIALTCMALNFLCKPDFIAYDKHYRHSFPVKIATKFHRTPRFVWTVKTNDELSLAHKLGEHPIFEKQFD